MADQDFDDLLQTRRIERSAMRNVASVGLTGSMSVVALSNTAITPGAVDATTTGVTFSQRIACPVADFDMIRVLIPNVATTPVTGIKCGLRLANASGGFVSTKPSAVGNVGQAVAANPNNQNVTANSAWMAASGVFGWNLFHFDNLSKTEIDLPAAVSANIPIWTATDWTPCAPTARVDGGTLPLVEIRLQYPAAGTTPASGASPSSPGVTLSANGFANWGIDGALDGARPFNGGRLWRAHSHAGLGLTTAINFQGSNTPQTMAKSVPIIVQFRTTLGVETILYTNDSIAEFNTTGEYANSYAFRAALAASIATGKAISWCPVTWPSGASRQYLLSSNNLLDLVRPSIIWAKPFGPNETTGTLTSATVDKGKGSLGYAIRMADRYKSRLLIEPHLAVNNAGAYVWGASDSFRISFNDLCASSEVAGNYKFVDLDPTFVLGGSVVSGQQQPLAANTSDGVHISDVGHAALTTPATTAITSVLSIPL